MNNPRRRPLTLDNLRTFEAVARRLGFGSAAEELYLTQPAVSRQIRALEDELGAPLFLRGTRHVELTGAGRTLLHAVAPMLEQLDAAVRQVRGWSNRRHVGVSTFASFATLWLLPRLPYFQQLHPDIDIRISAQDGFAEPDDPEVDLALRYCGPKHAPAGSQMLFGEIFTPVLSPSLLADGAALTSVADLARLTLIEADNGPTSSAQYPGWRAWLKAHAHGALEPRRWLHLDFVHQKIQAALAGQGVVLAHMALVADALAKGDLVEPFGATGRVVSPHAYWLVPWPVRGDRPELQAFQAWLLAEASHTRRVLGSQAPSRLEADTPGARIHDVVAAQSLATST